MIEEDLSTKGKYLGLCNRSVCLKPGADYWNNGSLAYYCANCAELLNRYNPDWPKQPLCIHETFRQLKE